MPTARLHAVIAVLAAVAVAAAALRPDSNVAPLAPDTPTDGANCSPFVKVMMGGARLLFPLPLSPPLAC